MSPKEWDEPVASARERLVESLRETGDLVHRHAGVRLGRSWLLPLLAITAGVIGGAALRRVQRRRLRARDY